MISKHAINRGIERIENKSYKKNLKANIKKIMRKDAYRRYFAYFQTKDKYYSYVKKDDRIYKYIISKYSNKVITAYEVNFDDELMRYPYITLRGESCIRN